MIGLDRDLLHGHAHAVCGAQSGDTHRLVPLDVGTPTFMRAPGETTGSFALESAMDELAVALRIDPLALRLKNYAEADPQENKPWSGKSLRECYQVGAEKFGWSRRNPTPRSMRNGNTLIGMGMATCTYPANRSEAGAIARILPDGTAMVASGTRDIGTGTYTVMTRSPPMRSASRRRTSTSRSATRRCRRRRCRRIAVGGERCAGRAGRRQRGARAVDRACVGGPGVAGARHPARRHHRGKRLGDEPLATGEAHPAAAIIARAGGKPIEATSTVKPGDEKQKYSFHSFGAVFVEVRVDADLGTIRVPRVVAVYDVGRVLSRRRRAARCSAALCGAWARRCRKSRRSTRAMGASRTRTSRNITDAGERGHRLARHHVSRPAGPVHQFARRARHRRNRHYGRVRGARERGVSRDRWHVRDLPVTLDKVMQPTRV